MGQALRKVNENYNKYESYLRIVRSETAISAKNNYENNHNNDDYYINIKKNKIKSYLDDLRSQTAKKELDGAKTMQTTKDRYTIQEAAKLMGVSIRTLELREKEGRITIIREKNKRRFVAYESIQAALNGEVYEMPNSENRENENNEINESVDNSEPEVLVPTSMSLPNNNFVTQDQLNAYTAAINNFATTLADIKQEGRNELDKQREYFESMLAQQQELTVSMFEELKREKDRENKEVLTAIENVKNDSYSNTENILKEYEWIKKQNEDILAAQSKRPWWKFWKK